MKTSKRTNPENKGGRPRKGQNQIVHKGYRTYLNRKENDLFIEYIDTNNLHSYSKSEIIKRFLLDGISGKKVDFIVNESPKYMFELNKIGSNINQIAKKMNSIDSISSHDQERLYNVLNDLNNILHGKK